MNYQRIRTGLLVVACASAMGCASTSFEQVSTDLVTGIYTSQEMRRDKNGEVERETKWDLTVGALIASFKTLSRTLDENSELAEPEKTLPCNSHKRSALDCN